MNIRGIGAVLILVGCAGVGFSIACTARREVQLLQNLIRALTYMSNMLQYQLMPLPELCRDTAQHTGGTVQEILYNLSRELDWQISPDAKSCMYEAIQKSSPLPIKLKQHFLHLGTTLGQFDIPGQVKELEVIQENCTQDLQNLKNNLPVRTKSYQTLGICSGAAIVILFL